MQNCHYIMSSILTGMEINEANLTELLGYLQKTLSPDGAVRKSGT